MKNNNKKSFFRKNIDKMSGYVPGEQPQRIGGWIKLNTNENPYSPSPEVAKVLQNISYEDLRLYPDPLATEVRALIAELFGLKTENVIAGNGSDDILTIALRCFAGEGEFVACPEPSYSLYPVLSQIQGAECIKLDLNSDFSLPDDFISAVENAKLLLIPRPNAPTGNAFNLDSMHKICTAFSGVVLIDEAYGDFAEDNCIDFVKQYSNVIVSRTLSKSYSLAGARFGYALASENLINGMMKVKDSYNVNMITQKIAIASLRDQTYLAEIVGKIKKTREYLSVELEKMNFKVCKSDANFVFVSPPQGNAAEFYEFLKNAGILVRYFPGELTGKFLRITVGTDEDTRKLIEVISKFEK